jgi:hypothetical protein
LAALFEGDQPVLQMAAPERKPKKVLTPGELAEQFRELQQLRKTVRELEQSKQSKGVPPKPADRANDAK